MNIKVKQIFKIKKEAVNQHLSFCLSVSSIDFRCIDSESEFFLEVICMLSFIFIIKLIQLLAGELEKKI